MSKFRKKPVVIEAMHWHGPAQNYEVMQFCGDSFGCEWSNPDESGTNQECRAWINTLEGPLNLTAGDWIIKGIKGEFYPCKPDIFEATYEAVE